MKMFWEAGWIDKDRIPATLGDVQGCVGPGWSKLVEDLVNNLFKAGWNGELHQVKEKFGGLRFYIGKHNKKCTDLIYKAEDDSQKICDSCGQPGSRWNNDGYILTRCSGCRNP